MTSSSPQGVAPQEFGPQEFGPELIGVVPSLALAGALGVPAPTPQGSDPDQLALPLLWHWLYLLDRAAQADLGNDGHPRRILTAGDELTARMFAGGRVTMLRPLCTGRPASRSSSVVSDVTKDGRSGPLRFVTHRYVYEQDGDVVVEDERDLVYRRPLVRAPSASPVEHVSAPDPADDEVGRVELDMTPTLLFRFSALTYNAHRIHYDRDFARDVEGHPGLVVHGPLQAIAMAEAARAAQPAIAPLHFEYRLLAPMFEGTRLVAIAKATPGAPGQFETLVRDGQGNTTARGTLTTREQPDRL